MVYNWLILKYVVYQHNIDRPTRVPKLLLKSEPIEIENLATNSSNVTVNQTYSSLIPEAIDHEIHKYAKKHKLLKDLVHKLERDGSHLSEELKQKITDRFEEFSEWFSIS